MCADFAGDDGDDLSRTSARVPPAVARRPRTSVAVQSPSVIAGDALGRGSFPDHGVNDGRRRAIQALMILRTKTTLVSEDAGNKLQIRRRIVSVVRLGNVQLQANPELVVLASIFAVDRADVDFIYGD